MEKIVITIARQYGSGGRTVGEMLAHDLGIKYYDREILKLASDESGINEGLFERADEKLKNTHLFKVAHKAYNGELIPPDSDEFTSNDNLFNYQAKIIRDLAMEESCVIIGRCADFILRDLGHVVSVFVHAPEEFCIEQATKKLSLPRREIEKYIHKTDKRKAEYYKYYTGREWTDARNYDLCLNCGKLGFLRCMEEIKAYIGVRFAA